MVRKYINTRIDQTSSILGLDLPYFIKGGLWLTLANVVSIIVGVFLSSLFSKVWPKDVYGQFSFLTSVIGLLGLTTLSGMNEAVFQGSIEKKDGVFKYATKKVFLASLIGSFILFFGVFYFLLRNNSNLAFSLLAASVAFPFYSLGSLAISFYKGKRDFKVASILTMGSNVFSAIATSVALVKIGSLVIVALVSTWSTAIVNILFILKTNKIVKNKKTDKKLLRYGVFLSLTNFIWLALDYVDRLLIPVLLGFDKNAIYSFAILIPMQIQVFFKMFVTLGQPKVTGIKERDIKKAIISKSIYLEIIILLVVIVYVFASPQIFRILYPDYEESIFITQIFSLTLLYYPSNIFGIYLTKKRLIKESAIATIIFALLSLISLLLFVYLWGLIGAVISKIFSRVIQFGMTLFIFFRESRKDSFAQSSH